MIKIGYDRQTAGCRLSFVMKDGEFCCCPVGMDELTKGLHKSEDYTMVGKQTKEKLILIRRILDHVIESYE